MADGFGLREQLDARIAAARRSLFGPAFISAIGPAALWLGAFFVLWLTGVFLQAPLELQAVFGLLFWSGFIVSIWLSIHRWRAPTDQDARDLIDSAIEGRPLNVWADRPARADNLTWSLWAAHRDRMAALASKLGKLDLKPYWRDADRLYLRLIVPGLVIAAAIFANTSAPDRLMRGAFPDYGALFGAHKLTTEAWVTPPTYTGNAPFVLTAGEVAKVPEGSEVTLRVISPGRPSIKIIPEGLLARGATLHLKPGIDGAYEAKIDIDRNLRLAVNYWGERASFPFSVADDATPKVEFVSPPKLGEGDETTFEWKVSDDFGVTKLELVARLAQPPAGAEKIEEAVPIEMLALDPKEETGKFAQDLVRHRWAGLDVMVKLRATDASGAFGESAEVAYGLPEKLFLQPLARSAQEMRAEILREWKPYEPAPPEDSFARQRGTGLDAFAADEASRMRYAPEGVKRAAFMIDALTFRAETYFEDPILFMGFRHVRALLDAAQNKVEAEDVEGMLWDIALRAEYGSVADASAALDAARRALDEALRNGASEEEIRRLMDMFEQAVENYLAAQMAEALRNGRVQQGDGPPQGQGGGMQMGDDELQRMLDALRDLGETGAREQARQLLSDMSRMLDRMQNMQLQVGRGGGGQQQNGPMSRALNRALQETNRSLNDQRDLNDQTEQAQRDGGGPQRGQQLADRQRQLRERMEQQMRDQAQGQGQQPGQGQQGQQGQGQQGQGQGQQGQGQQPGQGQGQGQQGQGQGQGQQRGQGQGGQGDPNGQPGQRADRGGRGGALGPPGVNADGTWGQESERSRQLLGRALDFQRRAEDALRRGDFAAAQQAQSEAMAALQARSGELARLADEADPQARQDRNQRDILGRLNGGESGYGDNVRIPDEIERQKARDIIDEIRRRAGIRNLRPEELQYLQRLLDLF